MTNDHDTKSVDLIAKMLSPLAALGGPFGKGATFALALLRTAVDVMQTDNVEADEILKRMRQPRALKTWDEIGDIVDADLAAETKREKLKPSKGGG